MTLDDRSAVEINNDDLKEIKKNTVVKPKKITYADKLKMNNEPVVLVVPKKS